MSGAQPKAGNIAGVVSVTAEINPLAARKRHEQGWVDELHEDLDELMKRIRKAMSDKEVVSLAYVGNVVDLWERLADEGIDVDLGSDQTVAGTILGPAAIILSGIRWKSRSA